MRKKRIAKSGYIYILESKDKSFLKYGASINPKERIRHINYSYKENPFYILETYYSKDIYSDECRIKWHLWEHGLLFEIFSSEIISKDYIVDFAKKICDEKRYLHG